MLHPTMARACGLEVRLSDAYKSIFRSRQLVKISAVLIAMLIVGALVAIWGLRQGAINDTEDDNHRLGVVLAEQATRTFQGVDLVSRTCPTKSPARESTIRSRCTRRSVCRISMRR